MKMLQFNRRRTHEIVKRQNKEGESRRVPLKVKIQEPVDNQKAPHGCINCPAEAAECEARAQAAREEHARLHPAER